MSASTDLYVPDIARALGFDETICTRVSWNGERVHGELISPNCRGAEKSRQLADLKARHPGLRTSAYGNSGSDIDHLARVEEGVLVNGSGKAQREAMQRGIRCERWT